MTDRPILFSAPMVRAILEGRKTETRRVLRNQPPDDMGLVGLYAPGLTAVFGYIAPTNDFKVPLRFVPGDRLWVRESLECANGEAIGYPADGTWLPNDDWRWQREKLPSIHMPRWLSRITLIVTDVRVQRLTDIDRGDAMAEGFPGQNMAKGPDPRDWFRDLWNGINADRGYGWDVNPWVAAISFDPIFQNIDMIGEGE